MAVVRRYNELQELENIDVLIDEFDKSRYITISDFPDSFPQGKSSFLIETSNHLKVGVELQIDIFDSEGVSIYHEPIADYLEGTARRVSVEVHGDTAPGMATMIIAAELQYVPVGPSNFSDVEEVPDDWKNTYNLRFTKNFLVNQTVINTQAIKFYTQPKLTITEKVYGTLEVSNFGTLATASIGRIFGAPINDTEGKKFEKHDKDKNQGDYVFDQLNNDENQKADSKDEVVKDPFDSKSDVVGKSFAQLKGIKDSVYDFRSVPIVSKNSPVDYPYNITIENDSSEYLTKYTGGRVIFTNFTASMGVNDLRNIEIESTVEISASNSAKPYSASIDELGNNKTALTRNPFTYPDKNGKPRILPFEANGIVEYEVPPSSSFDYTNTVSVADITLANLRTFSGEAFAAEILIRSRTSQDTSDFKTLAFVPLQPPELLVNPNVIAGRVRTGYFGGLDGHLTEHEEINTYWNVSGSSNAGLDASLSGSVTASFDNKRLLDSVFLSGSIDGNSDLGKSLTFQLDDAYSFYLRKNVDYTLSFNAVARNDRITDRAVMSVYVSGSIATHNDETLFYPPGDGSTTAAKESYPVVDNEDYGYRLGYLQNLEGTQTSSYGRVEQNFAFNTSGSAIIQFRVFDGEWNLSDISVSPAYSTGFSPSYVNFLQQMPDEFLVRPDKFDFLVNFYDRSNNLADAMVRLENVEFSGSNMVVVGTDNVLKGNMFIGGQSGDGIDMGGAEAVSSETGKAVGGSGYVRSIGYQGYLSASNASLGGKYGFMMFSGSVWPGSGDNYKGVGLELVGASGSMRFRTNPSLFDVQADSFFVGKTTTQFISGSGQKIEISSSNFHLSASGDVNMTGTITANAGNIGGWTIEDGQLSAGAGNSSVTMSGEDQLIRMGSGSQFGADNVSGVLFGQDTDGKYKFQIGEGISYIYFDGTSVNIRSEDINVTASVFSVDVDVFKLSANNLFISSSDGGFISAGNPRPTGITGTNKGFFVQGNNPSDSKTKFLVGDAAGGRLSFDGDTIFMSSSAFYLGSGTQFVSGANSNVEISSSNFHLSNAGDVTMTGKITANEGTIGGFNITNDALSSTNFLISGSSTGNNFFISSSNFNVKASGDVTASALSLTGGEVGGLAVASGEVSVGSILKLKDSGQITGSKVLFSGGRIAGWTINGTTFEDDEAKIRLNAGNQKITINSHTFGNTGIQLDYNSGTPRAFIGKAGGGFLKFDGTKVEISSSKFFLGSSTNFISGSDGNIKVSGSKIELEAPTFLLGRKSTQFVSGSNGQIEISSSQFHLTKEGNVTGSAILLGDKGGGNYLQFVGSTLSVRGDITADTISVPSAAPTPSSSIASDGLLTTVSASIGGFDIVSSEIKDKDNNLRLKSSGQITGSQVLFTGGKVGGWTLNANQLSAGNIRINATSGYIEAGGLADIDDTADASTGFFVNGDGQVLIKAGGANSNFIKFKDGTLNINTDTATVSGSSITLETPKFFLGKRGSQFVSGSNNLIEISSSKFHLKNDGDVIMNNITASNANISGKMTATSGEIAGFTIDSGHLTATNFRLDSADATLSIGTGTDSFGSANRIFLDGDNARFSAGSNFKYTGDKLLVSGSAIVFGTPSFRLGSSSNFISGSGGNLKIVSSGETTISGSLVNIETPSFFLGATGSAFISGSTNKLQVSSSNFQIKASGDTIMAGKITATSGFIGGWTINSDNIADASNLFKIDKTALQISIKNHTFGQAGVQLKYDTSTSKGFFYVGDGANDHIQFNDDGVSIKTDTFILDTTNLDISSTAKRITIHDGSNERVRIGEVAGSSTYGLIIYDGTGTAESDEIVNLSSAKYQIASWSLSPTQITSNNLVIDSAGVIQSSNFASNTQGWRITAANNGEAEFENVKIRGTLSTAVFEKETVNAVGGQLYIANSTALTGSTTLTATNATMSVINVTGFTGSYGGGGEILAAKKVTSTGFNTEYMFVQSASRDNPASDTDFTGKLFVIRGYRSGSAGDSGSLGDTSNISQSYEPGQVIVSTGRVGTGFIRLNANPNDTTTPYIDIVERTGSGVYDVDLKARLGDLSGLSSGLLYGESNPGFGLFTENVFLQGAITATTGSITGQLHINTSSSTKMKLGTDIKNGNDGIYINDNNFWYTNGHFRTGFDASNFIHQSGSKLEIKTATFDLDATTVIIDSAGDSGNGLIRLGGSGGPNTPTSNTAGIYMDGGGAFNVVGDADNLIRLDGGNMTLKSEAFDLQSTNLGIDTSRIFLGTITALDDTSGRGFYVTSSGFYNIQNSDTEYIRNVGSGFELKAQNVDISGSSVLIGAPSFRLGDATNFISGSGGSLVIQNTGTTTISGSGVNILTPSFFMGTTGSAFVSGSNSKMEISSSKFHIKSSGDLIVRKIDAEEGTIGGFTIDAGHITATNIRLDSADAVLSLGTGTDAYGNANRIYLDGDNSKFSVGTQFKFNEAGTGVLEVSGSGIVLGAPSFRLGDGNNFISGSGGDLKIFASGETTISGSSVNIETPSFFMGATGSAFVSGSNSNLEISSSKFHIKSSGDIIVRKINATEGTIGGFTVNDDTLTATNFEINPSGKRFTLGTSDTIFIADGDEGIQLGHATFASAPFNVDIRGRMTASSALITGSGVRIGVEDFRVKTPDFEIDTSTGKGFLKFGENAGLDSGAGMFVSESGQFALRDNDGNEIKIGSPLSIKSANIDVNTNTFKISSTESSMSFGTTPPSSITTGKGVYVSGSGIFMLGDSDGSRVSYDGTNLIMSSSDFVLGDLATAFVSGANSNIEISSSRFHLERAGKVSLGDVGNEHVVIDTNGITIKDGTDVVGKFNAGGAQIGSGSKPHVSASTSAIFVKQSAQDYLQIDSDSVDVYAGGTEMATFGSTTRIGDVSSDHVTITSAGMRVMDGTAHRATFGADAHINGGTVYAGITGSDWIQIDSTDIDIYRNNVSVGNFADSSFRVGALASEHIIIDGSGMKVHDGATTIATFGSNVHLNNGQIYVGVTGSSGDWVEIDSSGIDIMRNNVSVANFGDSTARIGSNATPGDGDQNFLHIGPTSMSFMAREDDGANRIDAAFGSTTTIGQTAGKHVKITSAAVEVKTSANVTALSASSAGLEMSGKIKATSGDIGGYTIGASSIQSSNTTSNQTNTFSISSGANSGVIAKGDNSSNDNRNTLRLLNSGTNQLFQLKHFPDKDNTNRFMQTRAGVGPTEGIPAHKDVTAVPGIAWDWGYHNAYNEPFVLDSSGDPTNFPHSESIQILVASGSIKSKNKGVTLRYLVHHEEDEGPGVNDKTGGIEPGAHGEILRIGKIKDAEGSWDQGVTSVGVPDRRFFYGVSGSSATTASFGQVRATRFYGDGAGLTGVGGGGSMSTWVMSDGSTAETVGDGQTVTFAAGEGIDVAVSSTDTVTYSAELATTSNKGVASFSDTGFSVSSGAVTLDAAQTVFSSILNTSLVIGRDAGEQIDFGTDNAIKFTVAGVADEFRMASGGTFHADADIIAYSTTTASDKKLKINIGNTKYGLSDVLKLRGVDFNWKDKFDGKQDVGFIAQEVQEVIPELVKEVDTLKEDGTHLTVDYAKTAAILVEAIKEQQEQINELKKEIKELKDGSS